MFRKRNKVRRSVCPTFQKGGALGRRFNMPNRPTYKEFYISLSLSLALSPKYYIGLHITFTMNIGEKSDNASLRHGVSAPWTESVGLILNTGTNTHTHTHTHTTGKVLVLV